MSTARRLSLLLIALAPRASVAAASPLEASTARALGMGGAVRGSAAGSDAPFANPSGLSVLHEYVVEGGYEYGPDDGAHVAHVVAADSRTSALGAAPSYTYARVTPEGDGGPSFRRQELALTLSAAIAGRLMLGATGKYLWTHDETPAATIAGTTVPAAPAVIDEKSGLTYDVGLTIEATQAFHLGVAGYNLRDLKTPHAPRGAGGGLALQPTPQFLAAFDTTVAFTAADGRSNVSSYMGGAEVHVMDWLALRAGGGYDGLRENGYFSAGVSVLSVERGGADVTGAALDVGLRQDVSGKNRTTFLGLSARLFIPVPEAP